MKINLIAFTIILSFTFLEAQESVEMAKDNKLVEVYNKAVKYFLEENIPKAEENFLITIKLKPDDISTLKYLAEISIAKQDIAMIKYYYEKVLSLKPDDEDALISLGVIHLQYGNVKIAEEFLIKVINHQPANELALFNLAVLYGTTDEFLSSVKILEKLISINPTSGKYYQTLGIYYLSQNFFLDAEDNFLQALTYENDLTEARKGLVIIYQNKKELNESLKYITELETMTPDLQDLNILKAYQQYLYGAVETAIKYALRENEKYPEEPDAYFLLSDLYKINGDEINSRYFLERAEKLIKNSAVKTVYSFFNIK
jgi:tetratricopeptide (TPR) repeat protein